MGRSSVEIKRIIVFGLKNADHNPDKQLCVYRISNSGFERLSINKQFNFLINQMEQ